MAKASVIGRSHTCGELRRENIGQSVQLNGWVHRYRDHGGLIFIDLRDRYGLTQLVFDPVKCPNAHSQAEKLRHEWVIGVRGKVIPRAEGMANPNLDTGQIEVEVDQIEVFSIAKTPPIIISDDQSEVSEEVRLRYRYLDMRRGDLQKKLIKRHEALLITRQFLSEQGFVEITTPILAKSTPEGARDYLVPSRVYPGNFYALPQSPQIFKQLLMVGGMDRYFQIAPCFRDEDLRADRQPEFSQIDIEMSFGTQETFFPIVEELLCRVFKECARVGFSKPFQKKSYEECIEKYGTDKPDLRFGMEFKRLDHIASQSDFGVFKEVDCVKGICVKGGADISRKQIDGYTSFVGQFGVKGLAWMKYQEGKLASSIVKFFSDSQQQELIALFEMEEGDLIFMVADKEDRTNQSLDHLRRQIARDRNLIDPNAYALLWVVDFPLLGFNAEEGRLESLHHPFTSPHFDDIDLLDSEPLKVRSLAYDLVLNGYEIAGGSQRIHDSRLQQKIFETIQLTPEEIEAKFGFFVDALKYGTPPHLGMAFGVERLIMILTQTDNIRDVVAFPKTQKASDLMMHCPSEVDEDQLKELKLKLR